MLLGRAMVGPLFAQSAWNNVTFTGGEVRDPGRNLPRALLVGLFRCRRALSARESRLHRHLAASWHSERPAESRSHGNDASSRSARAEQS